MRLSIFPVPGKAKVLRSVAAVDENGSVSFDFAQQVADLSMTTAEARGRVYAQGFAPFISIQLSINSKEYLGNGQFYLPGIFSVSDMDIITLPLQLTLGESAGTSEVNEKASLILQVHCTPTPALQRRLPSQSVRVSVFGLSGKVVKGGWIAISMSCSNSEVKEEIVNVKVSKKISEFAIERELPSHWPEGDAIRLRLIAENGVEVGVATIPIAAVCSGSLRAKLPYTLFSVTDKEVTSTDLFLMCSFEAHERPSAPADVVVSRPGPSEGAADGPEVDDEEGKNILGGKKPAPLNSLGGRLLGCIEGFLANPGGSFKFTGKNRYSAAISLNPTEATIHHPWKESTQAFAASSGSRSMVGILWEKNFEVPIAWALSQRYALHLYISIMEESGSGKKRCIGEAFFDVVSLVTMRDSEIMTFFLPVFTPETRRKLPRDRDEIGRLVVGLLFVNGHSTAVAPAAAAPGASATGGALPAAAASANFGNTAASSVFAATAPVSPVSAVSARDSLKTTGVASLKNLRTTTSAAATAALDGSQTAAALGKPSALSSTLSASQSEISNSCSSFWRAFMAGDVAEIAVPFHVSFAPIEEGSTLIQKYGSDLLFSVDSMSGSWDSKLEHNDFEDTLKIDQCASLNIATQGMETALALNFSIGSPEEVMCECWVVLSKKSLQMGLPVQLDIPMRDNSMKAAVVRLGSHMSASAEVAESGSFRGTASALKINFRSGKVSDQSWGYPADLYFEATLLPPKDYEGDTDITYTGRSNWTSGRGGGRDRDADVSGLQCAIDLPNDAVPPSYAGKKIPKSAAVWTVSIVGRDASRPGCPALASGATPVPWSLLVDGKPVLDVRLPLKLESGRSVIVSADLEKVNKSSGGNIYKGVGSMLVWIKGAQFPRESWQRDVDRAQAVVRWSRDNCLAGEMFTPDAATSLDAFDVGIFSDVNSIQQVRSESSEGKPLVLSIPLPGAHADVKLTVSVDEQGAAQYSTIFPALSSVAKLTAGEMFSYPCFTALLSKENATKAELTKDCPRLQFSTIYVPYVAGKLIVNLNDVQLAGTSSWLQTPGTKHGILRFSLGTLVAKYSSNFSVKEIFNVGNAALDGTGGGGLEQGSTFKRSSALKKRTATAVDPCVSAPASVLAKPETLEIYVDTYDLLNSPSMDGHEEMLDLNCFLLDTGVVQASNVGGFVSGGAGSYIKAAGQVSTAGLYHQAMRDAITQAPQVAAGRNHGGQSPESPIAISLVNPSSGEVLGLVKGTVKFALISGSEPVIGNILETVKAAGAVEVTSEAATAELGLKQAYRIADGDNSGGISKPEVSDDPNHGLCFLLFHRINQYYFFNMLYFDFSFS